MELEAVRDKAPREASVYLLLGRVCKSLVRVVRLLSRCRCLRVAAWEEVMAWREFEIVSVPPPSVKINMASVACGRVTAPLFRGGGSH